MLIKSGRRRVTLLSPELIPRPFSTRALAAELRAPLEAALAGPVDTIVSRAAIRGKRRGRARAALLRELHADRILGNCWLIRPATGGPLKILAREARLWPLLVSVAVFHLCQYVLWILAWWLLGWMSVRGRFETGLFWAWMLLLLAIVPFRILTDAAGGTFAIRAGTLLKRRLLAGAFRLDPEEVRRWGVGQLLGRVIESDAVESLAVAGGFLALSAIVELLLTAAVLGWGAGSWLHVLLLLGAAGVAAAAGAQYYRARLAWTQQRLDMTNDMVERMIGHRTRLRRNRATEWNDGEDDGAGTLPRPVAADGRAAALLAAVIPRGWLVAGLLGLAPAFVFGGNRR